MFTYNDYSALVVAMQSKNIFLRHDVDFSLKKAVEFAEMEASLGIKSTYFILTNGQYYNPFYPENIEKIRMIKDLGHRIAMHYDLTAIKDVPADIQALVIQANRALLESALAIEVTYITFHKPMNGVPPTYDLIKELQLIDMIYPDIEKGYKYISDSGSNWREDPFKVLQEYDNIHINIHPVWWGEEIQGWETRIHDLKLDLELDKIIIKEINSIREYRNKVK